MENKKEGTKKTLKALAIVLLGLIIWSAIVYISIAFLKAELNPFIWSQTVRGGMLFAIFCYMCFSPPMVMSLKEEI